MAVLTKTLAFRVPLEIKEKLEKLAMISKRKKSDILLSWVDEKLELESWQIEEIKRAMTLVDNGEIATADEKLMIRNKWKI
jgi:predicted transcriptional regulator